MTAIDQVKQRARAIGLRSDVGGVIEDAIDAAGLELVPQPGGGSTIAAGPSVLRRRVPGSGGRGSVQICTLPIGTAGWMVWREHWTSDGRLVRSASQWLAGGSGLDVASVAGFTEAGGDVRDEAVGLGLSGDDADAGVAAIAAAGYALQPIGGGDVTSPLPAADVERVSVPGNGDTVQLVAVTLGTAGWAIWPERGGASGDVELDAMVIIGRPSGYSGSVFSVTA